jgi:Mrp family chromosome partitioning ATPase
VPAPVLGSIPLRRSFSLDDPLIRNAFQVLHANIGATAPDADRGQIVVVTSADAGADKSSVARGLAESAADAGTRALLIDGDLRGRNLSRKLGYARTRGFSDAAGSLEMAPPIVPVDSGAPFLFLPAGMPVANPSSFLKSSAVRQLLHHVRHAGRLIIVESPAAGALPDASILATHADCVLIVARTGATKRGNLTTLVNAFGRPTNGRVVGLVVIERGPLMSAVRDVGPKLVRPAVRE